MASSLCQSIPIKQTTTTDMPAQSLMAGNNSNIAVDAVRASEKAKSNEAPGAQSIVT